MLDRRWREQDQPAAAESPQERSGEPVPAPPVATVLALQQGAGNAAVARRLARLVDPDRVAFMARGFMPSPVGLDFQSATGGGGFNVVYDPHTQTLAVTLRVGFEFRHSLKMNGGAAAPVIPKFRADAADVNANFATVADRTTEVQTNWRWTPAEKQRWAQDYATMVDDVWGEKHYFVSDRWPDLFAGVTVTVDVHEGHRPTDHCQATVFKVPPGSRSGPGATMGSNPGSATGNTMRLTSAHLGATYQHLNYPIQFSEGSDDLAQAVSASPEVTNTSGQDLVDQLVVDLQPGAPGGGAPLTVTGHASTTGSADGNLSLSKRRADAVANRMKTSGAGIDAGRITVVAEGDQGATPDPSWQRADIKIGGGEEQMKAAHETGHLFGLGDEYTSPVGGTDPDPQAPAIGTPADHAVLPPMGGGVPPAVYENNDSVMSVGNVVRAQHYVTFLEALNTITAPVPFSYGGEGTPPAFSLAEDRPAAEAALPTR